MTFTAVGTTFAIALAATLSGCAGLPTPVEKPKVDVHEVTIDSITVVGVNGQVELDIFNPNAFGVPLRSGEWELSVGGGTAVRGQFDLVHTIPAKATSPVKASLRIETASAIQVGRALARGERTYELRGTLHFSTRLGPISVAFSSTGNLTDAT